MRCFLLVMNKVDAIGEVLQNGGQNSQRVKDVLETILRSVRFKNSPQLQTLLRYIVLEALEGDEDALKERIIGMNVFGRSPDYDTTDDPIVRSRMGSLRKRLGQFYLSGEGEDASVEIVIPNGTYHPDFRFRPVAKTLRKSGGFAVTEPPLLSLALEEETGASVTTEVTSVVPGWAGESSPFLSQGRVLAILSLAAVLGVFALLAWRLGFVAPRSELDLLWAPILKSKQPIYVYTGTIPVFEQESPLDEATSPEDRNSPLRVPEPPSVDAPRTGPERVSSWGEGMLTGSVYADIRLAAFLSRYNRTAVMRTGANLPYLDLKGSPLILVGSFDNYWTRVMNENLPFYLDRGYGIRERDGAHRRWFNPLKAEMTPRMMEDYALVFRVMNSKNGAPVLAVVGLSTCGTHAATDFATDPAQMRLLSGIPRASLMNKNIELVLRTSLVNCAPTSVDVVASKVW